MRRLAKSTALLVALFALTPALPVGAQGPVYQPDGRIRGGYDTAWKGDNIYNHTGAHQRAVGGTYEPPAGEVHRFRISIQNDGVLADQIKVKGAGSGSGWRVQYFYQTTNITPQVIAGTFLTPSLPPGAAYAIKAKLTTKTHPHKLVRLVTLTSATEPATTDVVKFVMLVEDVGCPPPGC
jgi:hypothetical protein